MSTHRPIPDKHKEALNNVAKFLDEGLNPGTKKEVAFALLIFPFGERIDSRVSYISNGSREEMICALREFLARLEGRHIEESADYVEPEEEK